MHGVCLCDSDPILHGWGAHTFIFIALKSKIDLSFIKKKKKVGSVTGHHLHLTRLNAPLLGGIQSSCSRQMAMAD